ncbi:MAG: glycosyltransferase, partial [Actinobacteria bacterium]|nr:glycosyltransferase [Actinomycetota bacterium]
MEYQKVKLICKQRFDFEGKTHFPGEVTSQIERVARRWVARGLVEYADPNALTRNGYLKHPKVSIIILVKDALKWVRNCIESLNTYTNNFELILVDNGSDKKTKEFLKSLDWLDYTLITNAENMGFSYGNNQAIKIAKYDYICFLNSDTLLSPNWLGKLMRSSKYF